MQIAPPSSNQCHRPIARVLNAVALVLLLGSESLLASSCVGAFHRQTLYEVDGVRIGLETDPTTRHTSPPTPNAHPASFTPEDIRTLMAAVHVSGWSGAIGGLLQTPTPIPAFNEPELRVVAKPIADALRVVTPFERVTFVLQKPGAPYDKDRTAGALFLRDGYLHFLLQDHYAFLRADTGGGEDKDPRDTKGMELYVTPTKARSLTKEKEPRWGPFEQVHVSYHVATVLAGRDASSVVTATDSSTIPAAPPLSSAAQDKDDLRLQIRELTSSNLELRERLRTQSQELEQLREELQYLQQEFSKGKSKGSPKSSSPETAPSPRRQN